MLLSDCVSDPMRLGLVLCGSYSRHNASCIEILNIKELILNMKLFSYLLFTEIILCFL